MVVVTFRNLEGVSNFFYKEAITPSLSTSIGHLFLTPNDALKRQNNNNTAAPQANCLIDVGVVLCNKLISGNLLAMNRDPICKEELIHRF